MATSGRIQSGSFNGNTGRFYFQWQLAFQDTNGNYSRINWQWGLNISGGGFWGSNAIKSNYGYINGGLAFGGNTWSNLSGNGDHQLLAGSWDIGHNNDGTKAFGMSSEGYSYGDGNFGNSGSWDLPAIARNVTIAYTSGNINDESNPYIVYNNPAGHGVQAWLELISLTGSTQYAFRNGYSSGADFGLTTGERNAIRSAMANVNSTTVRYVTYDTSTGAYGIDDRTISIVNANPTFSTIAYHDSNSTTSTLTGNDQFIIRNNSVLNLDIASGNKATANKGASMVSYTATINGVPTNISYTTSTINQSLGTVNAGSDQTLAVTATDSRGNTTTVNTTVTMVPYSNPTISATGTREDGFGEDTTIDITAGYSTITVSGTPKNSVNNTNGIGYKVWAVGDSEPGSYTNVASTYSGGNVTITSDPIETLDQDTEFNVKVKITDALNTTTFSFVVGIGKAALRLGTDGKIYNENKLILSVTDLFPVGSVITRTTNTNPQSVYGGTWTATSTASASLFGETLYAFKRTV